MNLFNSSILLLFLLVANGSVAQFNFTDGPTINLEITQPYELMDINCVPDTAKNITINWELIEIESSIPVEWDFTICDYLCYPFFPSTGIGVTYSTADWDSGAVYNLKLGVSHNNVNGSGSLTYYLFDVSDPTYGDTLVFNLNFQSAGIENNETWPIEFSWLNTPNGLLINTETIARTVQVFSPSGQLIFANKIYGQELIRDLPDGTYLLRVDDEWIERIAINNNSK